MVCRWEFIDTEEGEADPAQRGVSAFTDMKKYSLILFGDASANLITFKLKDKIPLKISSDEIDVDGKTFKAKDAFVRIIYPHPLNPERYVSVIGATSGAGMFLYNGVNEDFDFVIQDGCIPNNRLGRPMDKLYIAKGYFDYNWKINDGLLETGDPVLRKNSPVKKVLPDLTTTIDNLPKIDSNVYKSLSGRYEIQPGVNVNVFVDADKLMARSPDGRVFQLYPVSETEYFIDVADLQITFNRNENGAVLGMVVHEPNGDLEIKKVE